jgi:hypothetical protein
MDHSPSAGRGMQQNGDVLVTKWPDVTVRVRSHLAILAYCPDSFSVSAMGHLFRARPVSVPPDHREPVVIRGHGVTGKDVAQLARHVVRVPVKDGFKIGSVGRG